MGFSEIVVSSEGRKGIPIFIIFHLVLRSGECRDEEKKGIEEKLRSCERFVLLLLRSEVVKGSFFFFFFKSFLISCLFRNGFDMRTGVAIFFQIEGYLCVQMQKQRRKGLEL